MVGDSTKYDWYQTDSNVCITYMRKNLTAENVEVQIKDTSVDSGYELLRSFTLAHAIDPEKSTYRISSVKLEVKLQKLEALKWSSLEAVSSNSGDVFTPAYPSSSKVKRDWNMLEKEAAAMEDDGDPLNKLFQQIYADASDETRRAMVKSFTESSGTVLSTNWNEVGKDKVEMKPPDGMEFKKYDL